MIRQYWLLALHFFVNVHFDCLSGLPLPVCVVGFWDQDSMPFWDQLEVERQRESTPTQPTHTCVCCLHMTPHLMWYPWVMHGSGFFKGEKGHATVWAKSHCVIVTNLYKRVSPDHVSLIMSRKPLMWTPRVSIRTLAELCMWWQCSWQSHLVLYARLYLFVM